jgi:chromosome segregation ATPase
MENAADREGALYEVTDLKLRSRELDQLIADKEAEGVALLAGHAEERAADKNFDQEEAIKEEKYQQQIADTNRILDAFAVLESSKTEYTTKRDEWQAKLDEVRAVAGTSDSEGNPIEVDEQKEFLYADYVDTYQQQIDILEGDVESKRAEMEQVLQNKKFREEQEAAQAAEKAKQAEFDDMRAGLDDAKHEQDYAQSEVNRLQGEVLICESAANQGGEGEQGSTTPPPTTRRLLQEAPEDTTTGGDGEGSTPSTGEEGTHE